MRRTLMYDGMREKVPAIPPNDYKGTMANWFRALKDRGYTNAEQQYHSMKIPYKEWKEVLKECEENSH